MLSFREYMSTLSTVEQNAVVANLDGYPLAAPQPGPQTQAFNSPADELGYGGAAGGGKTSLGALLTIHKHEKTVAFRREKVQLSSWVDDVVLFTGTDDGLNRQAGTFRYMSPDGLKLIEWGGLKDPDDWLNWRGRPHDLMIFEEATEIPFGLVKKVKGWLRTTTPGQRCRILFTFNPPGMPDEDATAGSQKIMTSGRWVIDYFAPWIDERHPDPAEYGELRYFYRDDRGVEREKKDGKRVLTILGDDEYWQKPVSRTFIQARVEDNKYLAETGYRDYLLSLEEPFRSQMLRGDFTSGIVDIPNQVIKTAHVDAAIERWEKKKVMMRAYPMNALGVDVSRGGANSTVLARRHVFFIDDLVRMTGEESDDGPKVAAKCVETVRDNAQINVDVIGPGTSVYDCLAKGRQNVKAVKSQQKKDIPQPDPVEIRRCYNLRASLWLLAKKIFDPANGCEAAIPPDKRLRSELIAVRQKTENVAAGDFQVEAKEDVMKRLGYSTDEADAVIYTLLDILDEPWAAHLQGELHMPVDDHLFFGRPLGEGNWMAR